MQKQFVPTYIVYVIGAALIAQIQNMLGNRERLRNEAVGKPFVGSAPVAFWLSVVAHVGWFSAWIAFLLFHSTVVP